MVSLYEESLDVKKITITFNYEFELTPDSDFFKKYLPHQKAMMWAALVKDNKDLGGKGINIQTNAVINTEQLEEDLLEELRDIEEDVMNGYCPCSSCEGDTPGDDCCLLKEVAAVEMKKKAQEAADAIKQNAKSKAKLPSVVSN